jgi:hypothetical protein
MEGYMRLPTLLVLFLAGSIPAIGATAQSQPNPTVQDSVQVSDQPETPAGSNQLFSRDNRYNFSAENRELEKPVCYKMRSYHMVRQDQGSDVTHMDGYTTCQPSSRFQTKRTVLDQP